MTVAPVPDPEDEVSYDLDAVIAEREPAKPFTFRFDGEVYSLPPRPDMRAAAAFAGGRFDEGLRILLGPVQWELLISAEKVFDDTAFLALYKNYQDHIGEDLGESPASPKSSRSTAKR